MNAKLELSTPGSYMKYEHDQEMIIPAFLSLSDDLLLCQYKKFQVRGFREKLAYSQHRVDETRKPFSLQTS
jgi:hypothetical protein